MKSARGFTLVEILLVVIILGIISAVVIPQFQNVSENARHSSVQATLQTIRSQIELFKLQHQDIPPAETCISNWQLMLTTSTTTETNITNPFGTDFGRYFQAAPINPINGQSAVNNTPATTAGWVYILLNNHYTIQAVDTTGSGVLTY